MNTYIENKQIFITPKSSNSVTLLNGSKKSHLQIYLPKLITNTNDTSLYHTCKICHLEIPYSFYVVNENNNQLIVNNTTLEVPIGNYNALTLLEAINQLFSDNGFTDFELTFNSTNGKYTLTSPIYFYVNPSSISKIVGLDNDTIYNSIFDFITELYILEFPYLANTGGTKNIYIRTNIITNNLNTANNDVNILKSVAIDVPPFGFIMYSNKEGVETLVKNREMNSLEIELLDDDLREINFNNLEWSITIEFKTTHQLLLNKSTLDNLFGAISSNE